MGIQIGLIAIEVLSATDAVDALQFAVEKAQIVDKMVTRE